MIRITIILSIISQLTVFAQTDTIKVPNKQLFLNELKAYELDSSNIANLYKTEYEQTFFYDLLNETYQDNKLSDKQSFNVIIFSFYEFSKLIPKDNKLKKDIYANSSEYITKKINSNTIKIEAFKNELITIKEIERQEQINKLENKYKIEEIIEDTLLLREDTTLTIKTETIEQEEQEKRKFELEEQKLKKEEQKMLKAQELIEEERKKIELEEKN